MLLNELSIKDNMNVWMANLIIFIFKNENFELKFKKFD